MTKVTGNAPIGTLPFDGGANGYIGLTVWECAGCKALLNDVSGHVCPASDLTPIPEPQSLSPMEVDMAKLAALTAADLLMHSIAEDSRGNSYPFNTFGEIADETVRRVEASCAAGTLELDVASWERDPEDH